MFVVNEDIGSKREMKWDSWRDDGWMVGDREEERLGVVFLEKVCNKVKLCDI